MVLPWGNGDPQNSLGDRGSPREELRYDGHPCPSTASRHWCSNVWAAGLSTFSTLAKHQGPLVAGEQG